MSNTDDQLKERLPLIVSQSIPLLGLKLIVLLLMTIFLMSLVWVTFQGPYLPGSWTGAAVTFSFMALTLAVIGGIYLIVWHLNFYYIIGEGSIIRQKGVFWKRRKELNIHVIQTLRIKQSFIGRLFGYATVHVDAKSYDEGPNSVDLKYIPRPYYYLDLVKRVFEKDSQEKP